MEDLVPIPKADVAGSLPIEIHGVLEDSGQPAVVSDDRGESVALGDDVHDHRDDLQGHKGEDEADHVWLQGRPPEINHG